MSGSPLDAVLSLLISGSESLGYFQVCFTEKATEALSGVKVEVGVTLMSDLRPPPCSPCWNLCAGSRSNGKHLSNRWGSGELPVRLVDPSLLVLLYCWGCGVS